MMAAPGTPATFPPRTPEPFRSGRVTNRGCPGTTRINTRRRISPHSRVYPEFMNDWSTDRFQELRRQLQEVDCVNAAASWFAERGLTRVAGFNPRSKFWINVFWLKIKYGHLILWFFTIMYVRPRLFHWSLKSELTPGTTRTYWTIARFFWDLSKWVFWVAGAVHPLAYGLVTMVLKRFFAVGLRTWIAVWLSIFKLVLDRLTGEDRETFLARLYLILQPALGDEPEDQ